jgi:Flp pilus assembly protein TadG
MKMLSVQCAPTCLGRLGRTMRDQRGVSALEFSIIATFMVTLMLGAFDFGNAAQQQIALQEAVRTGGEFARFFPTNQTGIQNAVLNALPSGWTVTGGVPSVSCTCSGATVTCTNPGTCAPPFLITITASRAYTALTPVFAAAIPSNTATYVTRIQ